MNTNTTPTTSAASQPKRRHRWIAPTAIGAAALFIGVGIGSAGTTTTTVSASTPTATVTAEPEVITETVTEEVEVQVTPEACITALDLSGEALMLGSDVITYQSEALGLAADALSNPFAADQAGVDRIIELTGLIEDATAQMEAMTPEAGAASTECRGAL